MQESAERETGHESWHHGVERVAPHRDRHVVQLMGTHPKYEPRTNRRPDEAMEDCPVRTDDKRSTSHSPGVHPHLLGWVEKRLTVRFRGVRPIRRTPSLQE